MADRTNAHRLMVVLAPAFPDETDEDTARVALGSIAGVARSMDDLGETVDLLDEEGWMSTTVRA